MKPITVDDSSMARVRGWVANNKHVTQQQLGELMGFPTLAARQSVHQFLKSKDPRISTLRRFAIATGIDIAELVAPLPKTIARKRTSRHAEKK